MLYLTNNYGKGGDNMTDNELLLAISNMMDKKLESSLKPIENQLKKIEVDLLENNVIPRLNTIESCYTDAYF